MSKSRQAAKSKRYLELGLLIAVISVFAFFGAKKVQEYRKPRGKVMKKVDQALDATKDAAVAMTTKAPSKIVGFVQDQMDPDAATAKKIAELDQAIAESPNDTKLLFKRYRLHSMQFNRELAQADLERLIQLKDPYLTGSDFFKRAVYQIDYEDDFEGALPRAEAAYQALPDTEKVALILACIYENLDRNKDALKLYNEVLQRNPESREALWARGVIQEKMGNKPAADSDFAAYQSLSN